MLHTLNTSSSGLAAAREQVENVMNNLANENTPGYKKRTVILSEVTHDDARLAGRGVHIDGIERTTDVYMYDNLTTQYSKQSSLDELSTMLADIESIMHETEDSGISADLDRYFQSLEDLRANPNSEIYKNNLRNAGTMLVEDLKVIYNNIEKREVITEQELDFGVQELNKILNDIGAINYQMMTTGRESNDLLDKRDHLEQQLSKYVDVEIDRSAGYELKISGKTAVRFQNNIHSLNLIEDLKAQKDVYANLLLDGTRVSNLVGANWGVEAPIAEIQTIGLSGESEAKINFLGTEIAGSIAGQTAEETVDEIISDKANVIANWNALYPDKEIDDIVQNATYPYKVDITFKDTEGDIPPIRRASSEGINFAQGLEKTKGVLDNITYSLDNTLSFTLHHGDTVTNVPIGTDPETYEDITVDKDNLIRAMAAKINNNSNYSTQIVAYNGQYSVDSNGEKILTNNPKHPDYDSANPNKERHLIIEARKPGDDYAFTSKIIVKDEVNADILGGEALEVKANKDISIRAVNDVKLEIFDDDLTIKFGMLKPMIDNLNTDSPSNLFTGYKRMLDDFAVALADLSSSYVETSHEKYVYGKNKIDTSSEAIRDQRVDLGLFSGSSVNTIRFDEGSVNKLVQADLDYLSTLQWKKDINFGDDTGEGTSFAKFYQSIKVQVADDKENTDFKKATQDSVTNSLKLTYEKLTKVDKDEEMMQLIKFQAAYEANAKMITVIDEMLKTLLGMKR